MKKILFTVMFLITNMFAFEHLTAENIEEKVKGKKVILDFYASWCPPCKIIAKNLNTYDKNKKSDITIYKIDIDDQRSLLEKFDVKSIPTIVFLDNGKIKHSQVGVQSVNDIKNNVKKYLK